MPLDTQTFGLSRWWAKAALKALPLEPQLFSNSKMRIARKSLIAGKNQITAIKNWLIAAQLIAKVSNGYELTKYARRILQADAELERSTSWWAFHLLVCFGNDPYPYDMLFRSLDSDMKNSTPQKDVAQRVVQDGPGISPDSVETYLQGVYRMFRDDGPLQDLDLLEIRRVRTQEALEGFIRLGNPQVPGEAIVFALSLAKFRFFPGRVSLDFSEIVGKGVDRYLALSLDDLRKRLKDISRDPKWTDLIQFTNVANLESLSFGQQFQPEGLLVKLIQEGGDSWQ